MITRVESQANKNLKEKFIDIFKSEYYSFILAVFSFVVSKIINR